MTTVVSFRVKKHK